MFVGVDMKTCVYWRRHENRVTESETLEREKRPFCHLPFPLV